MDSAASKAGVKDREMVHRHTGFIPTPKPNPSAPPIFINAAPGLPVPGEPDPKRLCVALPTMEEEALQAETAFTEIVE
jgi:hypothetical protein